MNVKNNVHVNLTFNDLVHYAKNQPMVHVSPNGVLSATTGEYTGRYPKNRYIVETPKANAVDFGVVNQPMDIAHYEAVYRAVVQYIESVSDVFIQHSHVGADSRYALNVRFISESPWHTAFAQNMFIDNDSTYDIDSVEPDFTILHTPFFNPTEYMQSGNNACVIINFDTKIILIAGTQYAGEIKKCMFYVMNYILPQKGVMAMHCSANMDKNGTTAVFFGLSGTGKTALSADTSRILIGDDEHGWSDTGVFNFEGGCYAKAVGITAESDPEIFATASMNNTILENVVVHDDIPDFSDESISQNTRISYPIKSIVNASATGIGGVAKDIIMLTCDAFGVLPPVSKLTKEQAMYHFLSGYTAKVAGTEIGIVEPVATFSACFGAPFMPLHPTVYGALLQKMIEKNNSHCWLVNTGWTGGSFGVGSRIKLSHTRDIIHAILNGCLDNVMYKADGVFGLNVPQSCGGVASTILNPIESWADKDAYLDTAYMVRTMFEKNYKNFL